MARSNLVACAFEWRNFLVVKWKRLAVNALIAGRFMCLKNKFTPVGCLSLPQSYILLERFETALIQYKP